MKTSTVLARASEQAIAEAMSLPVSAGPVVILGGAVWPLNDPDAEGQA